MTKKSKKPKTELKVKNIREFFKKKVTKFGTGAKINCPKKHLNKEAYVIILE